MPRSRGVKFWVYLKPSEIEYVQTIQHVLGLDSTSETMRFMIRLCRLLLPRANLVTRIVSEALKVEESKSLKDQSHQGSES